MCLFLSKSMSEIIYQFLNNSLCTACVDFISKGNDDSLNKKTRIFRVWRSKNTRPRTTLDGYSEKLQKNKAHNDIAWPVGFAICMIWWIVTSWAIVTWCNIKLWIPIPELHQHWSDYMQAFLNFPVGPTNFLQSK